MKVYDSTCSQRLLQVLLIYEYYYKTNYMNQNFCLIHRVTWLLGGKWKIPLIFVILGGPMCFGQLKRVLNPFREQMLTKQLRELEKHNLIERRDYKTVPTKVEYFQKDLGRSFTPIISQFQEL